MISSLVRCLNPRDEQSFFILKIMKKIKITAKTEVSEMVELDHLDSPDYPLLDFKGFGARKPAKLKTTQANYPRKTERSKGNIDALKASTSEGWAVKRWPLCVHSGPEGEELFDGRHTFAACKSNNYPQVPVAIYGRKQTGNPILDALSLNSVMTLMGLFANAIDGTTNAKMEDFSNSVKMVIESEDLPLSNTVVDELLSVTGVTSRFAAKGTITQIRKAILNRNTKSCKVFNTTKEEQTAWIKNNPFFGTNNYSSVDGVAVRSKVIQEQYVWRYAGDILRHAFSAFKKQEMVRVIVMSNAEHEQDIELERKQIIDIMAEIFNDHIGFATVKVTQLTAGMVNLPEITIQDLPIEIWAMPQIEGETEAIQLL